jgi:WD40 repeat protein
VATHSKRATFTVQDQIQTVRFSPDGVMLAVSGFGNNVQVFDLRHGKERLRLKGHTDWVNAVAFSPDGLTLASGGKDMMLRLWDIKTGTEKLAIPLPFWITSLSYSPDGNFLAVGILHEPIQLWKLSGRHRSKQ